MSTNTIITLANKQNEQAKHLDCSEVIPTRADWIAQGIGYSIDDRKQGIDDKTARENIVTKAPRMVENEFNNEVKKQSGNKKSQEKRVHSKPAPFNVKATALSLYKKQSKAEIKALIAELQAFIG